MQQDKLLQDFLPASSSTEAICDFELPYMIVPLCSLDLNCKRKLVSANDCVKLMMIGAYKNDMTLRGGSKPPVLSQLKFFSDPPVRKNINDTFDSKHTFDIYLLLAFVTLFPFYCVHIYDLCR